MTETFEPYFRLNQFETIGFQDFQLNDAMCRIVHIKHDLHSFKNMFVLLYASEEQVAAQTNLIVKQRMVSKL